MIAVPATLSERLRLGILGLAALGIVGTTIELVFLRHWSSTLALIVWPALIALAIAFRAVAFGPTDRRIRRARWLALAVVVVGGLGVGVHVWANLEAGPLDQAYETTWSTMSVVEQWFLALTGGVGPAPTLAPGALAEIAFMVGLATVGHPVLRVLPDEATAPVAA